jgi:hypothetical protein
MSPKCPQCGYEPPRGRPKKINDREVLKLRKKGLSLRQIAAKLKVSLGAVQASLGRVGTAVIIGSLVLLQACSSSRAVDTRAEVVPAPLSGYTCFAIVSGEAVVGGNCVRD